MSSLSRRATADALLIQASRQITERDRCLCRLLLEHRVLTTTQVLDLAFDSLRKTSIRLNTLHRLRVVDRFRPRVDSGSAPYHWVLDVTGAAVLSAERGIDADQLPWRANLSLALAANEQLGHLVGVNGFFTSLAGRARRHPGHQLAVWWPERRCTAAWGDMVRPDGYGVWVAESQRLPFLLEYDNGTEQLARLAAKLPGYEQLLTAAGRSIWVLFCFTGSRREAGARRVLATPEVPIATAVLASGGCAADAIWLPVGVGASGEGRSRLADLGDPSALGPRHRS